MHRTLTLEPGALTMAQLMDIHAGQVQLQLPEAHRAAIRASQQVVQNAADGDAPVYGVNTGFGKLANQRISKSQLATLQLNLIRSHCVGVGEPLQPAVMRLMLALKAASLAVSRKIDSGVALLVRGGDRAALVVRGEAAAGLAGGFGRQHAA